MGLYPTIYKNVNAFFYWNRYLPKLDVYIIVTIIYSAIMIMFFFYFSIKSVVFGQPNIENL